MILPGMQNNQVQALHKQAINHLNAGQIDQGIEALYSAVTLAPYDARLHNNLGQAFLLKRDRAAAYDAFKKAFDLDPHNPNTLNNLGILSLERGDLQPAKAYLDASLQAQPAGNFDALNTLGNLYANSSQFQQAEQYWQEALKIKPNAFNVKKNLALTYFWLGDGEKAIPFFEEILEKEPENIELLNSYAVLLGRMNDDHGAIKIFDKLLALNEGDENAWIGLITRYEHLGEIEKATEIITKAEKHCTGMSFALVKSRVARHAKDVDLGAIAAALEDAAKDADPESADSAPIFSDLGHLFDRLNETDKAFSYFQKSNDCHNKDKSVQHIDRDLTMNGIKDLQQAFTADWVKEWSAPVPYEGTPQPIFLVGFPRSGTTLLDQILHSHPDIEVAEEHPVIGHLLTRMTEEEKLPYPGMMQNMDESTIQALQTEFFDTHRQNGMKLDTKLFIDKLPLSMIHAGFIHRLFPNAKFIMALRHPCDCALSCYMQRFQINTSMVNFLDLERTATLYDASFSLWEQYEDVLPLQTHNIRYEDVVADFQPTVAALLEYLDVPWDDAVLEYDRTARERGAIRTPSYNQVTQKIYTRAKGRWERYSTHMAPVLDVLLPWAKKHGYED